MRTARKDVIGKINESAMNAVSVINQVLDGEIEGVNANARLGAAKLILNKCVPDLRAVDFKGEIDVKVQEFVIGGEDDTSQA